MFSFFYFFTGIYNSTNNDFISTMESVVSNMNESSAKNKYQYNQTSNNSDDTNQFLEQEDFELAEIIENALDLEEELQYKNRLGSASYSPIFYTMNSQCFKDRNNETLDTSVIKKLIMDDNSKCVISEDARHSEDSFQNSFSIYNNHASNGFEFQKQCDEVLNSDKDVNDQSKNIKCKEITTYKDKIDLMNKFYYAYIEKFTRYLVSKKVLNYNLVFQNGRVQPNNKQLPNLDIFVDFCRGVLSQLKSAFDRAKNEQILISKKDFFLGNIDQKFIYKLSKAKRLYYIRKKNLNKSIEFQIKKIEEDSIFKESSCESIKELIVECNMFLKEVLKYLLSFTLTTNLQKRNLKFIYNECKDISQRITNISQTVQLECTVVIINMLIERLERPRYFLVEMNRNLLLFFNSMTYLSTNVKWLISPLKDIMDSIDKKYESSESN